MFAGQHGRFGSTDNLLVCCALLALFRKAGACAEVNCIDLVEIEAQISETDVTMGQAPSARRSEMDPSTNSHTGPRHMKALIRPDASQHPTTRRTAPKDSSCAEGGVHTCPDFKKLPHAPVRIDHRAIFHRILCCAILRLFNWPRMMYCFAR
jgi:hypothetical protein